MNLTLSGSGSMTATASEAAAISVSGTLTVSATVDGHRCPGRDCGEVVAGDGAQISENSETHLAVYAETAAL